jgi:hypothetical protein
MAKFGKLASPVMCPATCFQRYPTTRLGGEEVQQLCSADPLAEYRSPPVVYSMCVENMFSDIKADCELLTRTPPLSGAQTLHCGTSMPSAGRPPHHKCTMSALEAKRTSSPHLAPVVSEANLRATNCAQALSRTMRGRSTTYAFDGSESVW